MPFSKIYSKLELLGRAYLVMKILLTGATGFIGQYLYRALLKNNHELYLLKRPNHKRTVSSPLQPLETYHLQQLLNASPPPALDLVIHCATEYNGTTEQANLFDCNLFLPMKLMQFCASQHIPFINTDSFYSQMPVSETITRAYILSKKQCFEWGVLLRETSDLHLINLRLEHVYGPFDNHNKWLPSLIQACLKNEAIELTPGKQIRDFIYIDDVIDAYLIVINNLQHVNHEVGTGKPLSIAEMSFLVKSLSNSDATIELGAIPYPPGELMHAVANNHSLKRLGWEPKISLNEGLQKTISSIKENTCLI